MPQPYDSASLPLDEDLYCLTCGYNVRGLTGDPVRCPECGDEHELQLLRAPAWAIRVAINHMEAAPTRCVMCAAFACLSLGTALLMYGPGRGDRGLIAGAVICAALFTAAWPFAFLAARKALAGQPGWTRVVTDFHAAAALCTLWYPLLLAYASATGLRFARLPPAIGWVILLACVGAIIAGLRARRLLAALQRREVLRLVGELGHGQRAEPRAFRIGHDREQPVQ
jgi:hypothetical protein